MQSAWQPILVSFGTKIRYLGILPADLQILLSWLGRNKAKKVEFLSFWGLYLKPSLKGWLVPNPPKNSKIQRNQSAPSWQWIMAEIRVQFCNLRQRTICSRSRKKAIQCFVRPKTFNWSKAQPRLDKIKNSPDWEIRVWLPASEDHFLPEQNEQLWRAFFRWISRIRMPNVNGDFQIPPETQKCAKTRNPKNFKSRASFAVSDSFARAYENERMLN